MSSPTPSEKNWGFNPRKCAVCKGAVTFYLKIGWGHDVQPVERPHDAVLECPECEGAVTEGGQCCRFCSECGWAE